MKKEKFCCFPALIRHALTAWLLAVTIEYILLPTHLQTLGNLNGLAHMSFGRVVIVTVLGTAALLLAAARWRIGTAERWIMTALFAALAGIGLCRSFSWAFLIVCLLVLAGLVLFAVKRWQGAEEPLTTDATTGKKYLWITGGLAVLFFLFVSVWTVCRVYSFSSPSYDLGIFSQMFYNMKTSGLPLTTIERDGLLSHFHVHMSPIYYLMLPFYCLVPTPATLQVLQAAVLASAVIPLWKIGKLHGLPDWQRTVLCVILLLYPTFSGGASYDIHENCFLTPLILWLLYGIDRQDLRITAAAAMLTLTVKEDAAVYVAVIALWLLVRSMLHANVKMRHTGAVLLAGSLICFLAVTCFLKNAGDGVMTYRYNNFIYDKSGSLLTVIKAVLMNPLKALYECVDPEKLKFIGLTMGPLLGLPLLTRRYERYILLIPYILVNLMSDYPYQHNIFFQYTFGSTACLLYLTAVNLADIPQREARTGTQLAAALVCAVCFGWCNVSAASWYANQCVQHADHYNTIRSALSQIPEEASVAASTFYTTQLSQREILYDVGYCSSEHLLSCQYVVLSESDKITKHYSEKLLAKGYIVYDQIPHVLTIYTK